MKEKLKQTLDKAMAEYLEAVKALERKFCASSTSTNISRSRAVKVRIGVNQSDKYTTHQADLGFSFKYIIQKLADIHILH